MSLSQLLDLWAEECHVLRHVKPTHCGEASRTPPALNRVRIQAIGALARGFYPLSYPSAHKNVDSRVSCYTFQEMGNRQTCGMLSHRESVTLRNYMACTVRCAFALAEQNEVNRGHNPTRLCVTGLLTVCRAPYSYRV